jgi:class 3 adenylate cyclase
MQPASPITAPPERLWESMVAARDREQRSGPSCRSAMGSSQRLEFTAIRDTVNVASRLEGLTKELGAPVIISQTTHEEVAGLIQARSLGSVRVRGRGLPVHLYAVEGSEAHRGPRVALDAEVRIEDEEVS